jgi:hypothetical protein
VITLQRTSGKEIKTVNNVTANMKAEGFHVSAATKRECLAVASGKQSAQRLVEEHLKAYKGK